MLRTVFFGTPEFAVPTLAALTEAGYGPLRVVTQPSRPVGRGKRVRDPPVAAWAREHGFPVSQPEKVKEPGFMAEMRELAPDVAVVVAFGQIFRRELLELPRHGAINLHASLLPKYRGAAPIQAAIAAGETRTGVSTMQMDAGMDTGPVLLVAEVGIGPDETTAELGPRLARRGAELMVETLGRLERGELRPEPQDDALASYAPRLTKADAEVDWRLGAREIYNRLRAFTPWPGLASEIRGERIKILSARVLEKEDPRPAATVEPATVEPATIEPGTLLGLVDGPGDRQLAVCCGSGSILGLARVQRPGRAPVSAADFYHGQRLRDGERFHPTLHA
jgi:methionyl-tRNA formyltransferase